MSQNTPQYNVPQQPQFAPMKPKKDKKKIWLIAGGALVLMSLGFGMGQSAAGEESSTPPVQAEAPEVKTETKTVTEEVEVEKTPQSCIDALDYGDELIGYFSEALESAADSMGYAMDFDWDSLDGETAKLEKLTPKVEEARSNYDTAAAECRVN